MASSTIKARPHDRGSTAQQMPHSKIVAEPHKRQSNLIDARHSGSRGPEQQMSRGVTEAEPPDSGREVSINSKTW